MTTQKQNPKIDWGYYATTPRIVRTHYKKLTHVEKWLYVCLKDLCGDTGTCYRTLRVLSEETDLSTGTLSTGIRHLQEAGLVHAEKKRRSNNPTAKEVWHITIVDIWQENGKVHPTAKCSGDEQKRSPDEHSDKNVQGMNNNVQEMNKDTSKRSPDEQKRSNFDDRSNTTEAIPITEERTPEEERESPPNTLDTTAIVSSDTAHAFSSSGEIDEAMIRDAISELEEPVSEELIQRTIDAIKQGVIVQRRYIREQIGLPSDIHPQQGDTHATASGHSHRVGEPAARGGASGHSTVDGGHVVAPEVRPVLEAQEEIAQTPTTSTPAQSLPLPQAEQAASGAVQQVDPNRGVTVLQEPEKPNQSEDQKAVKWNAQAMVAKACELRGKPFSDTARPKETKAAHKLFDRKPDLTEEEFERAFQQWNTQWWRETNGLFNLTDLAAVPKNKSEMRLIIALEKLALSKAITRQSGQIIPISGTKRYSSYDDPNFSSENDFYPVEGGSYAAASI